MRSEVVYENEAALVEAFCKEVERLNELVDGGWNGLRWTAYHETAGWDLLLVSETGIQVGIEAKMSLNVQVVCQSLPDDHHWYCPEGPDYRAVLVPKNKMTGGLGKIMSYLGVTVIGMGGYFNGHRIVTDTPKLPNEDRDWDMRGWHSWCPIERCELPDYVPDVMGGKPAPLALTKWKVKAIKLMILLERRGYVTRADMKHLDLSPTNWTKPQYGFLTKGAEGYVSWSRTPDFRREHPVNYPQIEADYEKWAPADAVRLPPQAPAPAPDA